MIRRQCTHEYKIQPVIKQIRELHGLKPHKHMPLTQVWLGISMDEIQRMKESVLPRIEYYYPLIEQRMTRGDCMRIFDRFQFPTPPNRVVYSVHIIAIRTGKTSKIMIQNHFKRP